MAANVHPAGTPEYQREYYKRPHVWSKAKAKADAHTAWLQELKLESGCVDCGYREHGCALDFDHLPGEEKSFSVGKAVTYNRDRVVAEIAKCEVVCANCHRVRTAERRVA